VTTAHVLLAALALVFAGPAVLGITMLCQGNSRDWQARFTILHSLCVLAASTALLVIWWRSRAPCEVELPALLALHEYHWVPMLLVDGWTVLYSSLIALVYPVVVRFSLPSFHREPGSLRYWFLVTLLGASLWLLCVAGNLDTLFVAWEFVGVTSVLLIGFFRRLVRAQQNSLLTLVYYRIGDFLLLLAAVLIHHDFPDQRFLGFRDDVGSPHALAVALALLGGSLAKSAQLPMSPWLHRAMEGPAASSAIFYGALSVHLGPFLLLRTRELWLPQPIAVLAMLVVGAATAAWATLVGRTRPDAKTALAYSTMAQIGLMYVELALGWHTLVAVHLFAHAGLRTWQFLRSSSLIGDFQDNPVFAGSLAAQRGGSFERRLPLAWQRWLYLAASRLFWLDSCQVHWIARPFLALFRGIASLEDRLLGSGPKGGAA
jgi:NADH:ubiquinone oxidoreductase subunit 5 (subunit L)/multisubunit Na+/H+ antiporter MnhA subunit